MFRRSVALNPAVAEVRKNAETVAASLVGRDEAVARCITENGGCVFRVAQRDGMNEILTADLQRSRINVTITNGAVTATEVG